MKMVKVYDFKSKHVSEIPAAELSPQMAEAYVEGIGLVFINVNEVRVEEAPYLHKPFCREIRDEIKTIEHALAEVFPMSLKRWEDGFRKEQHPTREIAIWLFLVDVYERCLAKWPGLDKQGRKECFDVIAKCAMASEEIVLELLQKTVAISKDQVGEICRMAYHPEKE
jgi:hypothetical protein